MPPKEVVIPVDSYRSDDQTVVCKFENCKIDLEVNANRTLLLYYKTPDGYETYESYDGEPQNVRVTFGTDPMGYNLEGTPQRNEGGFKVQLQ